MSLLTSYPEWSALSAHREQLQSMSLRDEFVRDPKRAERFSIRVGALFVDYSKNLITEDTLQLLFQLADRCELAAWRQRFFQGEPINFTEQRAVLHTALRAPAYAQIKVGGQNVVPAVHAELARLREFSDKVRSGEWRGYLGDCIQDVVNIGIGGSDLGPRMVTQALKPYASDALRLHFIANVDGSEIRETLKTLDPRTTLFIIASKTFTTQETLTNAHTAREWFLAQAQEVRFIARHFVAVSTNHAAVSAFGIDAANCFIFWDWVGGRYSLWSSVGLAIILSIGMDQFEQLLAGARQMDEHFRTEPWRQNLPVLLALIGVWHINFWDARTHAIFPYDYYLRDLPSYLQQADMESNGKQLTRDNIPVDYATGPVLWGGVGVNGQHAFYQLLHQGTQSIPADFIIPLETQNEVGEHHRILLANYLAQTEALLRGKTHEEVSAEMRAQGLPEARIAALAPHRSFSGNRPSTSILLDKLTPKSLGNLLALYEHKIFVQGIIWQINSYDQWGVELGKQLSNTLLEELRSGTRANAHDSSTNALLDRVRMHGLHTKQTEI